MIIVQLSDTHIMAKHSLDKRSQGRINALKRCVDDINAMYPRPDAVIHTGDMTQDGKPDEFLMARAILAELRVPFYPTPGNRDGSHRMMKAFQNDHAMSENGEFVLYAIDDYPIRLIAMDSVAKEGNKGDFTPDKLNSLDALLAQKPDYRTALFMHHPPFDVKTARDPYQYYRKEAAGDFREVVSRHPQLVALFCGHSHRDYRANVGSVQASTMPSVATDLRLEPCPDDKSDVPAYHLHRHLDGVGFKTEIRWAPS
jgi:Icc protein